MPTIKIGKTSKKINSISRLMLSAVDVSVKLKEETSMHDPVFILQGLPLENDYNYCKWGDRYYWINEKVFITNDIMEFHCNLDPLATFHDSILGTTAFCSFADEDHWNPEMDDVRFGPEIELPLTNGKFIDVHNLRSEGKYYMEQRMIVNPINDLGGLNGTFVLRSYCAVSDLSLIRSGLITYFIHPSYIMSVLENLKSAIDQFIGAGTGSFADVFNNAMTGLFSGAEPENAICNLTFVPVPFGTIYASTTACSDIALGPYHWSVDNTKVSYAGNLFMLNKKVKESLYIPWVNITDKYKFLRLPKYTSLVIKTTCSDVEINNENLVNQTAIGWQFSINPLDGNYVLKMTEHQIEDSLTLGVDQGCVGSDVSWLTGYGNIGSTAQIFVNAAQMGAKTVAGGISYYGSTMDASATYNQSGQRVETTDSGMVGGLPYLNQGVTKTRATKKVIDRHSATGGTGIHAQFVPAGNLPPVAKETKLSEGLLAAATTYSGDIPSTHPQHYTNTENYNLWTITVHHIFPSIFVRKDGNGNYFADGYLYDQFCNEYGWPCNKRLNLGDIFDDDNPTHTSFVKCENASWVPTSATVGANANDIAYVNDQLNSGVFLER